jgi:hypothetical protein
MIFLIAVIMIIVFFVIGYIIGFIKGECTTEQTFDYVYKQEKQIYDQAYRKGVKDTRWIFYHLDNKNKGG